MSTNRPNGVAADRPPTMSVREISRLIETTVRALPRDILVRGDLINVSRGTRHLFASLRDGGVAMRVFIHSDVLRSLKVVPKEGTGVVVRASPSWYRTQGNVQLVVQELWIADPRRARREVVARLRVELEREGLLNANRRSQLPRAPVTIAVVGGHGSAAVLDVVNAVHRRSPRTHIEFRPTRLQGAGADETIAAAIRGAAGSGAQVVAVVRGGGGVDDFSPFDSRTVCEAIASSPVPIVTALGHEQDRTLADLAAHSSASTPTDAARFLVADVVDVKRELLAIRRRLYLAVRTASRRTTEASAWNRQRLASALEAAGERGRLRLRAADVRARLPGLKAEVDRRHRAAEALRERLVKALKEKPASRRHSTDVHAFNLSRCMREALRTERKRFETLQTRLTLAEPDAIVARGFVIVRSLGEEPVTSAWQARDREVLELQFADGTVRVHVGPTTPEGGQA